jgi:hypothetical protein
MKEFLRLGKLSAIFLLGAGLLFAGCMGSSSSSSDDDAMPISAGKNSFLVQVDPLNADIEITPLSEGAAQSGDGKIGIVTAPRGVQKCGWAGEVLSCDIKVTNLDTSNILTNARTSTGTCNSVAGVCGNATMNNSDYNGGVATEGAPALVDGASAGICYAERGTDSSIVGLDGTAEGCPTFLNQGITLPVQFIAPNCSVTETWELTNSPGATQKFNFVTWFEGATFYPENPYSGDSRFDFEDYTTFAVNLYQNDNLHVGTYCALGKSAGGWKVGTPWCSSPVAVDSVASASTIYLNMWAEFANRIERDQGTAWTAYDGCPDTPYAVWWCTDSTPENFEYYSVLQVEVIYDSAVVNPGAVVSFAPCNTVAGVYDCGLHPQNYSAEAFSEDYQNVDTGNNRVAVGILRTTDFATLGGVPTDWRYNQEVRTTLSTGAAGRDCWLTYGPWWPHHAGGSGIIDWTGGAAGCVGSACPGCVLNAGIDTDLDQWIGFLSFTVTGGAGTFSDFKVSQNTMVNANIFHSNATAAGGPASANSDDVNGGGANGWCYSNEAGDTFWDSSCPGDCVCQSGFPAGTPCCNMLPRVGCTTAGVDHIVVGSFEKTVCTLPPAWSDSRADCVDGNGTCGGKQSWNTHILVQ